MKLRVDGKKSKLFILIVAAFALCAMILFTLGACSSIKDSSFKDADYIEVQSLRFSGDTPTAEIKMSSTGEPSTYQLEVEVLPKNATNRALSYYIPSEYHQYVTVSETGLLTAHHVSDGVNVPVVIRSTTNEKAKINATVLVEDVAVSAIRFEKKQIALLYNGESEQIEFNYLPSHATDGRNATFRSLDDSVATVSSKGVVTPVKAGITHIWVECSTRSNVKITNTIEVKVSYALGQYQLEASSGASFNQVMGDYTPIEFSLLILGNNVDPNPKIQWYVDTEPVAEYNDRLQYTHIPDAQTQMSYRIRVIVTPYQYENKESKEAFVELKSDPITVYKAFNGITLTYDNQSSAFDGYRYGDAATFSLSAGDVSGTIAKYNWYMADYNDPKNRVFIGETLPDDKDLKCRINVAGDYILTSEAVNSLGDLVTQRTFYFSAEKLVAGDTLVVRPKLLDYGLPPDSYHWYTVPCNERGEYSEEFKRWIADTAADEVLYLPLTEGTFRFIVTASLGGVNALVSVGGEKVPFQYVSDVIRVYSPTYVDDGTNNLVDETDPLQARFAVRSYPAVRSLSIEGIGRNSYEVFLRWNPVEDVPSYQIELTKEDGSVVILDSGEDVARFGANYCYVPHSVVTLDEKFSVRVKQKRGLYSQTFWYGTENERGTGDETHILTYDERVYPYFETIGYNNVRMEYSKQYAGIMNAPAINGYVSDMSDLVDLLSFTLLYTPATNTYIKHVSNAVKNGAMYNEYSVEVFIPFAYSNVIEGKYPHELDVETTAAYGSFSAYAKMIYGALATTPYAFDYILTLEEGATQGAVKVTIDVPVGLSSILKDTATTKGTPSDATSYVLDRSEEVDYSDLPIDLKDAVYVYDSDELVFAAEQGYLPTPNTDSLSSLYKIAKGIAVRIVTDEMSDEEIALAFFDYIGLNTIIDPAIEEERGKATSLYNLYLFEEFRIEGVFLRNKAVDVGIAKAYALLCALYGIPCRVETMDVDNVFYVYNKVYLNGNYYVVDIARSMFVIDGKSVVTHDLFLLSDEEYFERFTDEEALIGPTPYGDSPIASTSVAKTKVVVRTQGALENVLQTIAARGKGVYGVELTFSKGIYLDLNTVKEALREVVIPSFSLSENSVLYYEDKDELHVVTLATVVEIE